MVSSKYRRQFHKYIYHPCTSHSAFGTLQVHCINRETFVEPKRSYMKRHRLGFILLLYLILPVARFQIEFWKKYCSTSKKIKHVVNAWVLHRARIQFSIINTESYWPSFLLTMTTFELKGLDESLITSNSSISLRFSRTSCMSAGGMWRYGSLKGFSPPMLISYWTQRVHPRSVRPWKTTCFQPDKKRVASSFWYSALDVLWQS